MRRAPAPSSSSSARSHLISRLTVPTDHTCADHIQAFSLSLELRFMLTCVAGGSTTLYMHVCDLPRTSLHCKLECACRCSVLVLSYPFIKCQVDHAARSSYTLHTYMTTLAVEPLALVLHVLEVALIDNI